MELQILLKNTSYLVTTKAVKLTAGVIKSKLIAIYLGTAGAGVIAQLTQISQLVSDITLLSMNDGLVKQIAESDKSRNDFGNKLAVLIKSFISIVTAVFSITLILSFYYSYDITIYFFGDIKYYKFCLIGLISFPILILNSISYAILKGFKEIKYIARSELFVLLINLVLFVPSIYFWGLTGSAIYITVSFLSLFLVNHFFARTTIFKRFNLTITAIIRAKVSFKPVKELLLFAGVGLVSGLSLIISDTLIRSVIVTKLGIDKIGIYSPVITWAGLFLGFILPSIGTYLFPRFSEAKTNSEITRILNDSIRFVTLMGIPFLFFSIPIRDQMITLLYNSDFAKAGSYLPWHFIGTLFYSWMYVFSQAMASTGRIKVQGLFVIITCLIDLAIVYLMVPVIGLYGWMLKYIVSSVIFFFVYQVYFHRSISFRLENKNILLMGYSICCFFIIMAAEKYFSMGYKINLTIGFSLTALVFFLLTGEEKLLIRNNAKRIKNKILLVFEQ